jgi:hypothetical protein
LQRSRRANADSFPPFKALAGKLLHLNRGTIGDAIALPFKCKRQLPPEQEPTEAEAEQHLEVLKDAMKVQMYFPQANSSSGFEVLRELKKRNSNVPA